MPFIINFLKKMRLARCTYQKLCNFAPRYEEKYHYPRMYGAPADQL